MNRMLCCVALGLLASGCNEGRDDAATKPDAPIQESSTTGVGTNRPPGTTENSRSSGVAPSIPQGTEGERRTGGGSGSGTGQENK